MDFDTEIPLVFDKICQEYDVVPVLHPYNLGWGGLVLVVKSIGLNTLKKTDEPFNELTVVKYAINKMRGVNDSQDWFEEAAYKYQDEKVALSPPQLAVGSWLVAAICTRIAFDLATDKPVKQFPEFYFTTAGF